MIFNKLCGIVGREPMENLLNLVPNQIQGQIYNEKRDDPMIDYICSLVQIQV